MYERTKEQIRDGQNRTEDSHIAKHWDNEHAGEDMPEFRFRIVKTFRDSLSRQFAESVRIDLRGENILNSKTVYSRNRLPRLEIQKPEWERMAEEKYRAESKSRIEEEDRLRHEHGEGQAVMDEDMMNDMWRKRGLGGGRMGEDLEQSDRPRKRNRRCMDERWGLEEDTETMLLTKKWLLRTKTEIPSCGMVQSEIKTWTWLEMEARKVITEIVDNIMKEGMRRSQQVDQEEDVMDTILLRDTVAKMLDEQPSQVKEQAKIGDLWTKLRTKQKEEQARRDRVILGEEKRAALLDKIQPWRWLEFEAKKVVQELTIIAVGRAEERKLEKTNQETKQLAAEKERRSGKKRKCPWSWLKIEARKVITEIVGEVEKQGRIRKGNVKKRELLSKLEEKRNEQEKKKEMELLGEIEKLGRLKKGQRMKRELLEKL